MPSATVALPPLMPMLLHSPRVALHPQRLMPVHPAGAALRLPVLMPLRSARVVVLLLHVSLRYFVHESLPPAVFSTQLYMGYCQNP
jgi:hypothetical protein